MSAAAGCSGLADCAGVAIARSMALLGARSALATPAEIVVSADAPWPVETEAWAAMRDAVQAHDALGPAARPAGLHRLQLTATEYWLLCLIAAAEMHADAAAALSIVAEDDRMFLPTPLAFARLMQAGAGAAFADALTAALDGGRLAALGLIETVEAAPGRPLSQRGLRLSIPDAARLLAGGEPVAGSGGVAIDCQPPAEACIYGAGLARGTRRLLQAEGIVWLRSPSARLGRQFSLDVATAGGERLLIVAVHGDLPAERVLARLDNGLLAIDLFALPAGAAPPLGWLEDVRRRLSPLMVLAPAQMGSGPFATVTVPALTATEARRVWSLPSLPADNRHELAARFRLTLPELRAALREVEHGRCLGLAGNGDDASAPCTALVRAIRAEGSRRMGRLVTTIEGDATLDRLVAPAPLKAQLADIVAWHRANDRVWNEMELGRQGSLGLGLTCLFSGPPGTGKTFAAQCVATELGLNLYRIDLSQVVSKYIGETEKALAQVFDEADAGHGVLLFDEADALFGKRSEVKDAHDRYANIEVGYLLQRIETFDGVLILASNLRNNIDPAFLRRIQFLLDFPMPDAAARQRLWEQSLPPARHLEEGVDIVGFSHRFGLAGGSIRNIAIAAAHLAAASATALTSRHLALATYRELEKIGQARTRDDFGPLAKHLPEETWTGTLL